MSEMDLDLKVASRALLWRMGFSTRLDVVLRAYVPAGRGRSDEDFTDLDVLGVAIAPGFHVQTAIADCKTSPRRSTERKFWLRGVGDLFDSDHAYMVRSNTVTAAARQLAARLRISVLTEADLHVLSASHEDDLGLDLTDENFAFLFNRATVERELRAFDG